MVVNSGAGFIGSAVFCRMLGEPQAAVFKLNKNDCVSDLTSIEAVPVADAPCQLLRVELGWKPCHSFEQRLVAW